MQHPPTARRQAQPPGVIDTLSAGYAVVNRRLWVLLVPILVDVFLWLGPQVSFSPLVDPVLTQASELVRQAAASARGGPPSAGLGIEVEGQRQLLMTYTTETNVLALIATRGPLALPSVAALLGGAGGFSFVGGWSEGAALLVVALALGLALGGLFRGWIAQGVRDGRGAPASVVARVPRDVGRVLGLVAALLGVAVLLGLPVLVVLGFATLLAPAVAVLGVLLVSFAVLFAEVHLFFALDAIFISGVGPLQAIQRSVAVVRRSALSTLGLILLTWLILAGMDRVWEVLAGVVRPPFGVALGILGNAYVASGLVAASMVFYKERADPVAGPAGARAA